MKNTPEFHELAGSARRVRRGASRVGPADTKEIIEVSIYVRRPPNAPPLHDLKYYAARPLEPKEFLQCHEHSGMALFFRHQRASDRAHG